MSKILGQRFLGLLEREVIHRPAVTTLTNFLGLSPASTEISSTGFRHYCTNTPATNETSEIQSLAKNLGPVPHYTLKIGSFSSLAKMLEKFKKESYESESFEACGYKWKMSLYPNGDEETKGQDHVSVFLKIQEASSLPPGWEIKSAVCKIFLLDQIHNKYIVAEPFTPVKLNEKSIGMGFPRLILLDVLKDAEYGFLIDGRCVIGAEIILGSFVSTRECLPPFESEGEYLPPSNKLSDSAFTWNLVDQYISNDKLYSSQDFGGGNCKWRLSLRSNGGSQDGHAHLSAFLTLLPDSETSPKVYAQYNMSIMNERTGDHKKFTAVRHLFDNENQSHGILDVSLKVEGDAGETLKDPLTIQVEITRVSTVQNSKFNWTSFADGGFEITQLENKWSHEVDWFRVREAGYH